MRGLVEKTSKGRHALIFQESVKSSKLQSVSESAQDSFQ